jgi:GrpB-like predicted nucleotidyltransferase (UPF0157 family)
MDEQWRIAKYDPDWKCLFEELGKKLRESLQDTAIRIDHIGSTSVVGLEAKPIIDIQISVIDFDDLSQYQSKIERLGFVYRSENIDKTKGYFREIPGTRRTHIHVRQVGSLGEQISLLFRDYLRTHPEDCERYIVEKHRLMNLFRHDREKYVDGKDPIIWDILKKATKWSQIKGWKPEKTDM